MSKFTLTLFLVLAHCLFSASASLADKRVALVIGNSAYKHAPALANPRNDADDIAAALTALGIEVVKGIDLDKSTMDRTIQKFSVALSGADVGIFFYAGHGLQVNGNNYLVPVDAELSTSIALEFEMVRLDLVQRIMEGESKTNIIFLDACRNNPLSRNLARAMGTRSAAIGKGLAAAESGVGTLVSFSTQPGNVALDGEGRNSPYTGSLVKSIGKPGEDVLAVLTAVRNEVLAATGDKQVPWENHALRSRFYFKPAAPVALVQPVPKPAAGITAEAAERAWGAVKDTNNPVLLESFLRRFGDSFYSDLAKSRLSEINRANADPAKSGYDRDIAAADKGIENDPLDARAYNRRANLYADTKRDHDRAIADFTTGIELDPKLPFLFRNRGESYRAKSDYDRAIADYGRALEVNPKYALAYANRGAVYALRRDYDRAFADFGKAIEIDPRESRPYRERGGVHMARKDYDKAFADFDKAIELEPKSSLAHNDRANAFYEKQDFAKALVDYSSAIALAPRDPVLFANRAGAQIKLKDYDQAIVDLDKSIELSPRYVRAYSSRALAYAEKQNTARATADYKKVLELEPWDPAALEGLKKLGATP